MREHTPGPWYYVTGEDGAVVYTTVTIATIPIDALDWQSNAHLIAAAPELLASLDGILQWWMESDGGDDMPTDLFDRGQAALKSARGSAKRLTSLSDIKEAVLAGKTVHWKTPAYQVICDSIGQWLIVCKSTNGCWGLTWADGVTMNEKPEDFFVGGAR